MGIQHQAAEAVLAAGNFDGNTATVTPSFLGKEHALADTYTRLQVYVLIFVEAETSAKYATERHTGMVSFLINKELERVYRVYPLALPSSYCKTLTTLLPTIRGFLHSCGFIMFY